MDRQRRHSLVMVWRTAQRFVERAAVLGRRVRARQWLFAICLVLPWLAMYALFEVLWHFGVGHSTLYQVLCVGLPILANLVVIVPGAGPRELAQSIGRLGLVLASVTISLGMMEVFLRLNPRFLPKDVRSTVLGDTSHLVNIEDLVFDKPIRVGFRYRSHATMSAKWTLTAGFSYVSQRADFAKIAPDADVTLATMQFTTDENGYINPSPLEPTYDLVAAGDSFSSASLAPTPWPGVVADRMGVTLLNLAMQGYGPQAEKEAIKIYGLPRRPSVVVVAYYEGNDLLDALDYDVRQRTGLDWLEYRQPNPWSDAVSRSVAIETFRYGTRSILNGMLRVLRQAASSHDGDKALPRYPLEVAIGGKTVPLAFLDWAVSRLTYSRREIEASENFRLATESYLELKRVVSAAGARLVLAYLPVKERVYLPVIQSERVWQTAVDRATAQSLATDRTLTWVNGGPVTTALLRERMDAQRDAIAAFAQANHIEFLDLTPGFQTAAAQGAELYILTDMHWNQTGHNLAGNLIARYLSSAERRGFEDR